MSKGRSGLDQIDFPKTYDISRIVDLVRMVDSQLADLVADAALTSYGIAARSLGDLPEPTREQAAVVTIAKRVQQAVFKHLAGRVRRKSGTWSSSHVMGSNADEPEE